MAETETMDVDQPTPTVDKKGKGSTDKKRFEVKKVRVLLYTSCPSFVGTSLNISAVQWNAVSLWAWGT